jgi:hypothetical protein
MMRSARDVVSAWASEGHNIHVAVSYTLRAARVAALVARRRYEGGSAIQRYFSCRQ